jgi:hypothetical protein
MAFEQLMAESMRKQDKKGKEKEKEKDKPKEGFFHHHQHQQPHAEKAEKPTTTS